MASPMHATTLKLLECPVCYNVYKSKIFMCENGHNICEECKQNVNICPTCRSELKRTRNHLVEELISKSLLYSCENSNLGCTVNLALNQIQTHQGVCHLKLCKCYVPECTWEGRKNELNHHIMKNHAVSVFQGLSKEILFSDVEFSNANSTYNDYLFIELKDELFAYFYKRDKQGNISFNVIYLGPAENATNFHFKLAFHNEDRSKKMQLKCNVGTDPNLLSDKCMKLDYNTCKQFVRYNGKFQYFLKVEERPMSAEVFEEEQ